MLAGSLTELLGAVTGAVVATTAPDDGNILPTFCLPEFPEYALVD
ncbi:hypothetical protein YPPY66_4145 [Yersinia pestis PY-66]|nr:hypothetical protein YPPY36_0199 [Yersinia pestis PY-36]EIS68405.1 hypothetical protein YPPY66_4145 [Yersinia pestis PY-66]